MSTSLDTDATSPLCDGQNFERPISKISPASDERKAIHQRKKEEEEIDESKDEKTEPEIPKPYPMAFTIDFGDTKQMDKQKLEQLARQSQARHQRVQSMSATLTRPSPVAQKPPLSAKLPRKTQGYNSEGYFSSDQEDSILSGSVKLRQSPLAQTFDFKVPSPVTTRHIKPVNDSSHTKTSKSPIVDSIMSRSDILPSRQSLNLPLKNTNSSYINVYRTPSYSNLSNHSKYRMADIIDHSPEGIMLTDISSPELEVLTPDNGLSTPETQSVTKTRRAVSEMPDILRTSSNTEALYINDDVDRQSNSSTGTYTIEADVYTEEQKARMSIDRTFGARKLADNELKSRSVSIERDPELIFDYEASQRLLTKEPRINTIDNDYDVPKVSKDKNVLEISCCYESPTEDLAAQTSKQIKSTRSYLEKIKNRVKTITEKTFSKSPPKHEPDLGNFTSVTTSGVLSSNYPPKNNTYHRRFSLTKSEIDQTDYVHRLSRESSVPVSLPSKKLEDTKFESTPLRNAQAKINEPSNIEEQVVGKLSHLSLNRCKGDKTWIQDWAESVKKYNNNSGSNDATFPVSDVDRPQMSPRHTTGKNICSMRNVHSNGGTPSKIPSPVGTLHLRNNQDVTAATQDTEAYLLKTQNAITNLQAKLHSSRTNNFANIPPALTSSLISEKTAVSRLPVSQLSRSNSLNYRLRRKDHTGDNSPLRSPGHYVITGSTGLPSRLLSTRSFDTDGRIPKDPNMNSPSSDRGLLSNSSDEKTLSNRPYEVVSPHRRHLRHKSFDGKNEYFSTDLNVNHTVSLKTVLKNNALEAQNYYPKVIDQTRLYGDPKRPMHQRILSDCTDKQKHTYSPINLGNSIKRSSSFNTVNKNNNYNPCVLNSRRSSGNSEIVYKDLDYLSDESDYDKSQDVRYKRPVHRGRIASPDLKSIAPANSPRCPNTPEMQRKFGPRNSVRVNKDRSHLNSRPPEQSKPSGHQSRRISEPTRQAVFSRLTKSRSSTREFQPKNSEKGTKKPAQYRSSSALATKEAEFTNWKKRSSYDPMKAAQEGKRRQQQAASSKRLECNKDDLSSPSHSSPVHRSQSFHSTNLADLDGFDYSSEGTEDEKVVAALPVDNPMITSTHSDILDSRPKGSGCREVLRRQAMRNDVVIARDYVANFQVNHQPVEKVKRGDMDKRKTFIVDDVTPTKDNIDFLSKFRGRDKADYEPVIDKRKTFILDSDTTSTTNGSSPRTSSIFSQEKVSLTTATSDTDGESGTESAPVLMRHPAPRKGGHSAQPNKRFSGDFSMSSSTTSVGRDQKRAKETIQPRYLDISKYKNENSSKNFLRRDPSKTYVGVLGGHADKPVSKGSAQHYEMEQKKQELEKWKRRASYDPRKAAALGKNVKTPTKISSSVLRSQSFHGPVMTSLPLRAPVAPHPDLIAEFEQSSDNDF